eukprot:GILJ01008138.1.p1 GENE.GILJ01008138.1~~GILJ01008138.1.p1  ORF type:complete len:204 (+),score=6.77 GILJ01008138.1:72-683(+)
MEKWVPKTHCILQLHASGKGGMPWYESFVHRVILEAMVGNCDEPVMFDDTTKTEIWVDEDGKFTLEKDHTYIVKYSNSDAPRVVCWNAVFIDTSGNTRGAIPGDVPGVLVCYKAQEILSVSMTNSLRRHVYALQASFPSATRIAYWQTPTIDDANLVKEKVKRHQRTRKTSLLQKLIWTFSLAADECHDKIYDDVTTPYLKSR